MPLVGGAVTVALGGAAWPYTVDDAFVLGRYAKRLVAGAGYTMNDGPPTDGITGPLGVVPAVVGEALLGDPVGASKAVGLAATASAVAVVARAARDRAHAAVTVLLALVGSTPIVWAVGGLETGLATLALTLAMLGAVGDPRRGALTGGAIAALAWLRPELAPVCGLLLVALARRERRAGAVAISLALLGALSIVAFRLALFETPLPLSAQAKPPDLAHGAEYVARAWIVQLGLGGPVVVWLGAREGGRAERLVLGAVLVHLAALVLAGGDWMPGFRLLAPLLPWYAWLAAGPIAARLAAGRRAAALGLLMACALVPALDSALQLGPILDAGRARDTAGVELADWIGGRARRVALVDVGWVGFRAPHLEVIDLGGITDPAIGRLPGGHLDKWIDPGTLRARDPDLVVLHSAAPPHVDARGRLRWLAGYPVEQRVARMAWLEAQWRVARVVRYAPDYHYVVLERAGSSPARAGGGTLSP
jgi:arabinofuranosyltransferase